ncbi:MAG: phage antirepressor KilAC domain-containing protein [Clostridium sp.]|nr:phage antirepressor KilAC domain-containing protein [Clostridium sp.]
MNFELSPIERNGQRVLTTAQLAEAYETTNRRISENFNANKERYIEGKHYYCLTGDDLKEFLQYGISVSQNPSKIRILYLWTEKGALLHAKSLNTDKAWEVYDFLVENYFNGKATSQITDEEFIAAAVLKAQALLEVKNKKISQLTTENAIQKQQIAELQPKASYYDIILNCKDLVSATIIAKDYGKSAQWLNSYLHDKKIQYKQGGIWILYQKYAENGYTCTKTHDVIDIIGEHHARVHTYWTQKGRLFIYDLLKTDDIFPIIERTKTT